MWYWSMSCNSNWAAGLLPGLPLVFCSVLDTETNMQLSHNRVYFQYPQSANVSCGPLICTCWVHGKYLIFLESPTSGWHPHPFHPLWFTSPHEDDFFSDDLTCFPWQSCAWVQMLYSNRSIGQLSCDYWHTPRINHVSADLCSGYGHYY